MNDKINPDDETLLDFPCEFPIKAMGYGHVELKQIVLEIIRQHLPETTDDQASVTPSRAGKYLSITVRLQVDSKARLDAIYLDLNACEHTVMVI